MMEKGYTALNIAKYMVKKCANDNQPISNLQLQKILFYIQKEYIMNDSLLFDDLFEAWQFGPVIPRVYYSFCEFGAMPIIPIIPYQFDIDINVRGIIDPIIEGKRELDPWDLVNETHKPGGAWDIIYNGGLGNHNIIPNRLIRTNG